MRAGRVVASVAAIGCGVVAAAQAAVIPPTWYQEDGKNAMRMEITRVGNPGTDIGDWSWEIFPGTPGGDGVTLWPNSGVAISTTPSAYPGGVVLEITIPNWVDNEPFKDFAVFIEAESLSVPISGELGWKQGGLPPMTPEPITFEEVTDPAVGFSYETRIFPNPVMETLILDMGQGPSVPPTIGVTKITVWSRSVPAPGVLATVVLGGVVGCRRRR